MDNKKIGLFIAQERKAKQLTQVDFAEKLYVSAKTVSKWENGNGLPHTDLLLNICSILDITLNELLCGERLSQEMEKIETQKNVLKTVITKRELETLAILTEILICAGIIISITLGQCLFNSVRVGSWVGNRKSTRRLPCAFSHYCSFANLPFAP